MEGGQYFLDSWGAVIHFGLPIRGHNRDAKVGGGNFHIDIFIDSYLKAAL